MAKTSSKIPTLLEALCYSAFLLGPLCLLAAGFTGHQAIKTLEKRKPNSLPRIHGIQSLPQVFKDLSGWFEDVLPGRQTLTADLNYALLQVGESGREKVIVGQDDWLYFSGPDYAVGRPRLSAEDLRAGGEALQARKRWLATQGVEYMLFLAPNKGTIYPEYLPAWRHPEASGILDQVLLALPRDYGIRCIDPRARLRALKQQGLVYLKHDVHWNTRSARQAVLQCWERIAQDLRPVPGLEQLREEIHWEMRWVSEQQGLAEMLGIEGMLRQQAPLPDYIPDAFDSPKIRLPQYDRLLDAPHYTKKMPDRLHPRIFHGNPDGPVVFLFTDSFGNWMGPWLQPHCSTLLMARRLTELSQDQKSDIVRSLVEQIHPEIMLEVVGEMNIPDIFPSKFGEEPR